MRRAILAALLATAFLSVPASAGSPAARAGGSTVRQAGASELDAQRAAARAGLVERLNQLAVWCNDKELFLERDRVWRRVLDIAPDDPAARKGLRYARNVDGSWKEPAPREVKNIGKKWLEELPAREEAAYAPYGDALLALARAPERSAAERDALIQEIRHVAPNHAGLHAWLGDVRLGDLWVLPETAAAKTQRPQVRAMAQAALHGGSPPPLDVPSAEEKALAAWRCAVQGENVRVLTTGPEAEAVQIARACDAVGPLLTALLGDAARYPGGYTLYVLTAPGEKETFLQNLPGVTDEERARMARLEGTGIPRTTNVALFGAEAVRRLDAAVRHTIGNVLGLTLGLETRTGWAWEGLGQYLTRELVGTRLTWFVSESADPAAADLRGKLMTPDSNWIQEAFLVLSSARPVPVLDVLARDLDHLDVPSALISYAFVAYLLEGRPQEVGEFVRRCAGGDDPGAVAQEVLKVPAGQLQDRLQRWLSERR